MTSLVNVDMMVIDISIHTPTRGVTTEKQTFNSTDKDFNPHSHEGSDVERTLVIIIIARFQSTLPRGE